MGGSLEYSCSTVFSNGRQNSTISFDSGASINCSVCYLVIKDGNHDPSYYFFDLTAAGWNGMGLAGMAARMRRRRRKS